MIWIYVFSYITFFTGSTGNQDGNVDFLNMQPNHKPQSNVDLLGGFSQPSSGARFEDLLQGGGPPKSTSPKQANDSDLLFDPFGGSVSQVSKLSYL